MRFVKPLLGCLLVMCFFATTIQAQGPLRRFGHAIVEHRPVRTAIANVVQARPVATAIKTIVQEKPIRSAIRNSYQNVVQNRNYGSFGTSYSYGSSGTSYSYGSVGSSYSYGSFGSSGTSYTYKTSTPKAKELVCPCGPNCQCNAGGTPCPCPKTDCPDCNTKGTEPPVIPSASPSAAPPITMGSKNEEPFEYSGTEASDNFHRSVVTAIIEARKEGKISRINAFALRGAMHIPSFQEKVKAEVIKKGKETGQIPLNATPEELGKIDFSKIDWIALIKALLPIILSFL